MENSNEPAFPFHEGLDGLNNHRSGLTKREYFAAMAMQGIISNQDTLREITKKTGDIDAFLKGIANISVAYSDALLTALNKKD